MFHPLLRSSTSVGGDIGPFASSRHRRVTGLAYVHVQFIELKFNRQTDLFFRVGIEHNLLFADSASTNHKVVRRFGRGSNSGELVACQVIPVFVIERVGWRAIDILYVMDSTSREG